LYAQTTAPTKTHPNPPRTTPKEKILGKTQINRKKGNAFGRYTTAEGGKPQKKGIDVGKGDTPTVKKKTPAKIIGLKGVK